MSGSGSQRNLYLRFAFSIQALAEAETVSAGLANYRVMSGLDGIQNSMCARLRTLRAVGVHTQDLLFFPQLLFNEGTGRINHY